MTDQELLELAAKAIGLKFGGDEFYDSYGPLCGWNPLADAGDALRLAIQLDFSIDTDYNGGVAVGTAEFAFEEFWEPYTDDKCSAVCRAIVRAAARDIKLTKSTDTVGK
jgi:hypothetical protein